jgi:hypothetical protein
MKRIRNATVIKPIKDFPMGSKIILDKSNPVKRKCHQLIWQQGNYYGQVGDRCAYLSHEELFELHEQGFIKLEFC